MTGDVTGSPVIAGQTFLGVELPMASPQIGGQRVRWSMPCRIRWDARHPCELSSVIGVIPPGQTRRAFFAYLERERRGHRAHSSITTAGTTSATP